LDSPCPVAGYDPSENRMTIPRAVENDRVRKARNSTRKQQGGETHRERKDTIARFARAIALRQLSASILVNIPVLGFPEE
jgi:hypothetical protein